MFHSPKDAAMTLLPRLGVCFSGLLFLPLRFSAAPSEPVSGRASGAAAFTLPDPS